MDERIKGLMDREIEREIIELSTHDATDQGYTEAAKRLTKLYKLRIDEELAESEALVKTVYVCDSI